MATSQTQLCNLALSKIGNEGVQITNFDTDTGKAARQCRLHYQPTLDELLRMHTWGCSKKRMELVGTIPSVTSSDGDVFTDNSTTINGKAEFRNAADDKDIRYNSTASEWEYGTWADPTFTATFTVPSTDAVPPEEGWEPVVAGTLSLTHNYGFGWTKAFRVPTDCIRPIYLTDSTNTDDRYKWRIDWTVEGRTILTNWSTAFLLYIGEPSVAEMDSLFARAFYTFLGSKLAVPVAGNEKRERELLEELHTVIMPEARRVNGMEGSSFPVVESDWLDATFASSTTYTASFESTDFGTFPWA